MDHGQFLLLKYDRTDRKCMLVGLCGIKQCFFFKVMKVDDQLSDPMTQNKVRMHENDLVRRS